MKIFLDDRRKPPTGYVLVRNLPELQRLLQDRDEDIEVMSFDHDLGDNTPDGMAIIKWMADNCPERWPEQTTIHSANPDGARNIAAFDRAVRKHLLPDL
ncbi:MAG: cyclic-phosphate processing receiver domain-containing protein [Patescibacteria group bacterium]